MRKFLKTQATGPAMEPRGSFSKVALLNSSRLELSQA